MPREAAPFEGRENTPPELLSIAEEVGGRDLDHLPPGRAQQRVAVDVRQPLLAIPVPILRFLVKVVFWLDAWNLLPHFFIADDPLYASAFIANLGSIKLDAAYHHLFEYGNIPIFGTIGRLDEKTGEIILRWNYDERTEDGLYCARALELLRERLENPEVGMGVAQMREKAG